MLWDQDHERELSQAMREFQFVWTCMRFGVRPGVDIRPRTLAVLCPACPQPGRNLPVDWQAAGPDTRYEDASAPLASYVLTTRKFLVSEIHCAGRELPPRQCRAVQRGSQPTIGGRARLLCAEAAIPSVCQLLRERRGCK